MTRGPGLSTASRILTITSAVLLKDKEAPW